MSISSFSQTLSSPKAIVDSNGVEMLAFTTDQLDIIKRTLVVAGLDKKRVRELDKKIGFLNAKIKTQNEIIDSLDEQYATCVQITVNKDGMIEAKEKQVKDLNNAIEDYLNVIENDDQIKNEYKDIIQALKDKIKKKNRTITGLIVIDIIIIAIVIL